MPITSPIPVNVRPPIGIIGGKECHLRAPPPSLRIGKDENAALMGKSCGFPVEVSQLTHAFQV